MRWYKMLCHFYIFPLIPPAKADLDPSHTWAGLGAKEESKRECVCISEIMPECATILLMML